MNRWKMSAVLRCLLAFVGTVWADLRPVRVSIHVSRSIDLQTIIPVPEPGILALLGASLVGMPVVLGWKLSRMVAD